MTTEPQHTAVDRAIAIIREHQRGEILDDADLTRIVAEAITGVRYDKYEDGKNTQCKSEYVYYVWDGWKDEAAAAVKALHPYLRTTEPVSSNPVSLVKFAISLCVWRNGIKQHRSPMVIWGELGQAARHGYIDQAKEALEAHGVPYVD